MKLPLSAGVALFLSLAAIFSWELYWKNQGRNPTIDDDKHLWALARGKINALSSEDVVIVGSSRVMFDIQLDVFEDHVGIRPVQLACAGSSPLPIFRDLVENTDFNGTVIVGVTPPLFFSTTFPEASPMKWPQTRVDHYYDRTLAERFNYRLSLPLQERFVLMANHDEVLDDNVDLKTLLKNIEINNRTGKPRYPPFFEFGYIDKDRNVRMTAKTAQDTSAANQIKGAWKFIVGGNGKNPPPDKKSTVEYFAKDAKKFRDRGGKIVFVRCPSTGFFKEGEAMITPRERFYDSLLTVTGFPGYHYADYPQLSGFDCPEWSHLSGPDADRFTKGLVELMIEDGHFKSIKSEE